MVLSAGRKEGAGVRGPLNAFTNPFLLVGSCHLMHAVHAHITNPSLFNSPPGAHAQNVHFVYTQAHGLLYIHIAPHI